MDSPMRGGAVRNGKLTGPPHATVSRPGERGGSRIMGFGAFWPVALRDCSNKEK
ncbi:MAG TPA: hypothetical protein VFK06_14805 [Candidatus Angelobacter sp.]|nr:hypothetical protein [Candidatus Angelobacter sp.]